MNMTGLDHPTFRELVELFEPYWLTFVMNKNGHITRRKRQVSHGRPRMLDAVGGLGLVFTWYKTKGARSRNLALNFGLTGTPMANWLLFSIVCLRSALVNQKDAKSQTTHMFFKVFADGDVVVLEYSRTFQKILELSRLLWFRCSLVRFIQL